MANGFIMGRRTTPGGGGEWFSTSIDVPRLNGTIWHDEGYMNEGIVTMYTISYPLTFQGRTFNDRNELISACGGPQNILVASGNPFVYISKGRTYWENTFVFSDSPVNSQIPAFTLYIYVRFVN